MEIRNWKYTSYMLYTQLYDIENNVWKLLNFQMNGGFNG